MKLVTDTREQEPLSFSAVEGVELVRECLPVGDYGAWYGDVQVKAVVERKSIGDLFTSFTSNYEAERAKMVRARDAGLRFILAIEAPLTEIRKGHSYWKNGQTHQSKKGGLAQIRQLLTCSLKYGIEVQYFQSRSEMAWWIQEYFLSWGKIINGPTKDTDGGSSSL